jgi:multidrug efflux pump subunit AcrA (membrane-fusion protein)
VIKYQFIIFSVLLLALASCGSNNDDNISTYTVSQKDFENILTIEGVIEPVRSTTLSCPRYIDGMVQYIIEDGTYVEEGQVVCIIEVKAMETEYEQLLINLENAEANLNTAKATMAMEYALLEAQVRNNDADTQIAQLDSLQLEYSPETQKKIKELELTKATIEREKIEKKLKSLTIIQQSETRRLDLELERFRNRVKSVKDRLDELTLKAPKKGLATRTIYHMTGQKLQVGDNVWGNMPLIIIPEMDEMKVKIKAPESDFKYISIGDSVKYTFDAMPDNMAWGKIKQKAPVGQPIKRDSKVKFFDIEATIDSMIKLPEPGFTVNCNIILKQVRDTISVPRVAVFEQDSIRVVYVKKKGGFEARQVLTGISSSKEIIISAGLNKEEIISLTKPSVSSIDDEIVFLPKEETALPTDSLSKNTN